MSHQTSTTKMKACKIVAIGLFLIITAALNGSASPFYLGINNLSVSAFKNSFVDKGTPSFTLEDKNGKRIKLTDLKGKTLLINFWAPWCAPCREEMPGLDKLYRHFKDDTNVIFITVDMDHNLKKSLAFMSSNQLMLPVYVAETQIPSDFIGDAIPATVIVDQSGKIVFKQEGGLDFNDEHFIKYLKILLTK
jgi:thiol-disulfide isomerase/thioredoxin